MKHYEKTTWTEKTLIENRSGATFFNDDIELCTFHRFDYGIGWIPARRCYHPQHQHCIGKKSPAVHTIPIALSLAVKERFLVNIPVGANFCCNHLKKERAESKKTQQPQQEENSACNNCSTPEDPTYEPDEVIISTEIIEKSVAGASSLSSTLETSPFQYQIKKKSF